MTTTEPGADERRIGMILRHFGVGYTPTGDAEEETEERTPQPRRWPHPPPLWILGKTKPTTDGDEEDPDGEPEEEEPGEEPKRRRPVRRPRTRRPDTDTDTEDEEEEEEDGEDEPKRTARRPKTRTVKKTKTAEEGDDEDDDEDEEEPRRARPQRRPPFAAPGVPKRRKSLLMSVRTMSGHHRWAIYNGGALALGFAFGLPQFFTAETAYLVATSSSWADPNCLFWYAVAAGIAWVDWRTRGWWPGLALLLRVPAASLVVGVLLYGDPT